MIANNKRFSHFLFFICTLFFFSCGNNMQQSEIQYRDSIEKPLKQINFPDTINQLLHASASKDTFEYEAFYNESKPYELLYVKSGSLFTSKIKHALALHSNSDTSILCELYALTDGNWIKTSTRIPIYIYKFSPAYFHVAFADYNFDNNMDVLITLYQSMGASYSYGYILTYSEQNHSLTLHPESLDIPGIEIDKKAKKLCSTEYSRTDSSDKKYKIVTCYDWVNDSLKLSSTKQYPFN